MENGVERLTKSDLVNGIPVCYPKNDSGLGEIVIKSNPYRKIVEKLKEYEDLEEQGLLLKPPCKLGDVVYDVVFCDDKKWHIFEMKVCSINPFGDVRKGKVWNVYLECVGDRSKAYRSFYDFGKTVFLTPEAAEEALKKIGSEDKQ